MAVKMPQPGEGYGRETGLVVAAGGKVHNRFILSSDPARVYLLQKRRRQTALNRYENDRRTHTSRHAMMACLSISWIPVPSPYTFSAIDQRLSVIDAYVEEKNRRGMLGFSYNSARDVHRRDEELLSYVLPAVSLRQRAQCKPLITYPRCTTRWMSECREGFR